jgi:hypothetical protein
VCLPGSCQEGSFLFRKQTKFLRKAVCLVAFIYDAWRCMNDGGFPFMVCWVMQEKRWLVFVATVSCGS